MSDPMQHRAAHCLFALTLLVYLALSATFAVMTPDWQAPDEPAHYNYIRQISQDGCCPLIEMGDWQNDYQAELTASRFAPDRLDQLDTIQYEDHQPPLYYLLGAPIFTLTDGSLTALRLLSALLGALVVTLSYFIARAVLPDRPLAAVAVAALVAFLPQHLHILTSVNNDALAEVIIALALLLAIYYLQGRSVTPWHLGLVFGVAIATKTTAYFLGGVLLLVIVMRWWGSARSLVSLLRDGLGFLLPASVFAALWWGRNISVYGFPDFLGLRAHDAVVVGQPRTAEWIAELGLDVYLQRAAQTTFNSFWGQFGWMALPMESRIYTVLLILLLVAISGALLSRVLRTGTASPRVNPPAVQRRIRLMMASVMLLAALAFVYYNTQFVQFQGRYLFPALVPFALLIVFGVDVWRERLLGRFEQSAWITPLIFLLLAGLDLYLLLRYIVPVLSP